MIIINIFEIAGVTILEKSVAGHVSLKYWLSGEIGELKLTQYPPFLPLIFIIVNKPIGMPRVQNFE